MPPTRTWNAAKERLSEVFRCILDARWGALEAGGSGEIQGGRDTGGPSVWIPEPWEQTVFPKEGDSREGTGHETEPRADRLPHEESGPTTQAAPPGASV